MKRRTLLNVILGIAAVPLTRSGWGWAAAAPVVPVKPVSYDGPVGGSGTAKPWQWVALPNSGGLQVHCTDATGKGGSVPVRWTFAADGTATVTTGHPQPVTVVMPPPPRHGRDDQHVATAGPYGLAVRRA